MKIRMKAGAGGSCCSGNASDGTCCPVQPEGKGTLGTDSILFWKDRLNYLRCRLGAYRMKYTVEPGLYRLGNASAASDVFVTANYKMSFDILRSSLSGMDAWILVLDTKGINVWCAAGKGTFGTEELVKRIFTEGLYEKISHRRLILPQLGAPGVSAPEVRKQTGFRITYGPVLASDLKEFVASGYKANENMRRVRFGLKNRLVLTPMELRPALKIFAVFSVMLLALAGISPAGISFAMALRLGLPLLISGAAAVLAGALVTPALLPYIPFRSFAVKGWLAGLGTLAVSWYLFAPPEGMLLKAASLLFFPLSASYIALQFTGSTTYTGASGVNKELKYSLPVYAVGAGASLLLFIAFKVSQWGLI